MNLHVHILNIMGQLKERIIIFLKRLDLCNLLIICLKYFWRDVEVATNVLTGYWMFSRSLNGKIPYAVLYPNKPFLSLTLRVFECLCFTQVFRLRRERLDPKAKCFF